MKVRFKAGDWFVVPLPSGRAVTGIIARAAGSRLFGYVFAGIVSREHLSTLRAENALWHGLFSARAIEDHRWRVIATSLRFDRDRWPVPRFAVREPFGRRWSQRTLEDETLATLATAPSDEASCLGMPDARIYEPEHVERLLDAALDGTSSKPLVVVDVHAPLDGTRLALTAPHARVQSGEPLGTRDTATLGAFLNARDDVALRLYGTADRATLLELVWLAPALRELEIDIPLDTLALLYPLERLERLTILQAAAAELPEPERFRALQSLRMRGTLADRHLFARFPTLRRFALQAAGWESAYPLLEAHTVRELEFADMPLRDLTALRRLPALRALTLRRCDVTSLDALRGMELESLSIEGLRGVQDFRVLSELPRLRSLHIRAMPHLNVHHFRVLTHCASLRALSVDLGSRKKNREIYRIAQHPAANAQPR